MRMVLAVGWFHIAMWTLGSLGALDYHLCIKAPAGACKPTGADNHTTKS